MLTMSAKRALLLIVDFQARLMPAIEQGAEVLANARRLLDAAAILEVPTVFTEQNAKGLGPILADLAPAIGVPDASAGRRTRVGDRDGSRVYGLVRVAQRLRDRRLGVRSGHADDPGHRGRAAAAMARAAPRSTVGRPAPRVAVAPPATVISAGDLEAMP